jgi:hypothetical protein
MFRAADLLGFGLIWSGESGEFQLSADDTSVTRRETGTPTRVSSSKKKQSMRKDRKKQEKKEVKQDFSSGCVSIRSDSDVIESVGSDLRLRSTRK